MPVTVGQERVRIQQCSLHKRDTTISLPPDANIHSATSISSREESIGMDTSGTHTPPCPVQLNGAFERGIATVLSSPLRAALMLWLIVCAVLLVKDYGTLSLALGDTDDAMRLVQWRAFLDGAGWYDLHIERVQPPDGLPSHWSRLVDAGLLVLYRLFAFFFPHGTAETLMRAIWPLLWILPALLATIAMAVRVGGQVAGWGTLAIAAFAVQATIQFIPGRIDHHNVQIALALSALACALWSDARRTAAAGAGLLVGLSLTIGLEALPLIVATSAIVVLRAATDKQRISSTLVTFGLTLAGSAIAGLTLTQPPGQWWSHTACDAMAANLALPVAAAGIALAISSRPAMKGRNTIERLLMLGPAPLLAGLLFYILDPACIKGPFARVDPALFPIWLDNVKEIAGIGDFIRDGNFSTLLLYHSYPLIALAAGLLLTFLRPAIIRTDVFIYLLTAHALTVLLGLKAVRLMSYAIWLSLPVMGLVLAVLWQRLAVTILPRRILLGIGLSPLPVLMLSALLLSAGDGKAKATVSLATPGNPSSTASTDCRATTAIKPLATLPAGRMAAPIDMGPAILAISPHAVLAAPYHRLDRGIIDNHALFAGSPDNGLRIALRWKLDYVVVCPTGSGKGEKLDTLHAALAAGHPPFWLRPVSLEGATPLKVYRVTFRGSRN